MPAKRKRSGRSNRKRPASRRSRDDDTATKVRVRMYRQGLGDCFLVTFDPGGNEVHMLIDCGTLGSTTTGVKIKDVVRNIATTTNNHIHLLVVTHEHQDHVSGLDDLKRMFDANKIEVDRVWLAWTENPVDDDAVNFKKYARDLGLALIGAARFMAKQSGADDRAAVLGMAVSDILGFAGDPDALGADKFAETVHAKMEMARVGFGGEARYLQPDGEVKEESWLPGFRFYVLGPPRSETALRELGDHHTAELYNVSQGFAAGALRAAGIQVNEAERERHMPFDTRFRLEADDPLVSGFLRRYLGPDESWRRVEHDWLNSAVDLALQLDNFTNNTSLALAIERISDGKVLLFPADAQLGNWRSWHDANLKWKINKPGAGEETVTAADLLQQTVFYKAGHHASHNGTASKLGLDRMTRKSELVAFIPVDRAVALKRNPPDSWQMPAKKLYKELLTRCEGRVVRSDLGWAKRAVVEDEFKTIGAAQDWTAWEQAQQECEQKNQVTPNQLYFDYILR